MKTESFAASENEAFADLQAMDEEQLPVPSHRLHGPGHFAGLYAAEHVAATEFVIGATFVALGATFKDILIGLLIGNTLAMVSYWLITTPIATQTRLSLYTYLEKLTGAKFSKLYNGANAIIFALISAAMITVSATAVRRVVGVPAQTEAYPTSIVFAIIAILFSIVAVLVAVFGFDVLAKFASICGPWLMVMFTVGGMVMLPSLAESITGSTVISSFSEFFDIASASVFTGINAEGQPGIGLWEVAGYAWAANTFSHFGLIDMALLRYARKNWYGLMTATGMIFGHYVAWISAGLMGAAASAIMVTSITLVDPGDVAWYALGMSGFAVVIVAGWTTANSNLYRAGLATQAVFPQFSRRKSTLVVGVAVVAASIFPFIYKNILPVLAYAGLVLVPIGGIVFAEHHIFPRIGYKRGWMKLKGLTDNYPAIITWALALVLSVGLATADIIPFYYLFIPSWLFSILCYTFLAGRAGAKGSYPEAEAAEAAEQERIRQYHAHLAEVEGDTTHLKDSTLITQILRAVWIVALIVTFVFAWRVLFDSPDLFVYYSNREQFYTVALWMTVVYFVSYWLAMQRSGKVVSALAEEERAKKAQEMTPAV